MKKSAYELEVSGPSSEVRWIPLTAKKASYWKKQTKDTLKAYITAPPEDRASEFPSVPQYAVIEGYWDEIGSLFEGSGPTVGASCTLYRLNGRGDKDDLWSCGIGDLTRKRRQKSTTHWSLGATPGTVLVVRTIEKASFTFSWKTVSEAPSPKDFRASWSPDGFLLLDIQLAGINGERDSYDGDSRGFDVELVSAKSLRLSSS